MAGFGFPFGVGSGSRGNCAISVTNSWPGRINFGEERVTANCHRLRGHLKYDMFVYETVR